MSLPLSSFKLIDECAIVSAIKLKQRVIVMKSMGRILAGVVAILAMTGVSLAAPAKAPPELSPQAKVGGVQLQAEPVTVQTMLSFEKPGQRTFVLERYDPKTGALIDRVIEPLKSPPELVAVKDFTRRINGRTFKSFGLDVCPVKKVFYAGEIVNCPDAVKEVAELSIENVPVVLCRSLSGSDPAIAACFLILAERLPNGTPVGGVSSDDDGIVLDGLASLTKTGNTVLRPDLERTQFFSVQQETGMNGLHRGRRK